MRSTSLQGGSVLPAVAWGADTALQLDGMSNLTCPRGQEMIWTRDNRMVFTTNEKQFDTYSCARCPSGKFNLFGGYVAAGQGGLIPQKNCTKCPPHSTCTTTTSISAEGYALYQKIGRRSIDDVESHQWLSAVCPLKAACPSRDIASMYQMCK